MFDVSWTDPTRETVGQRRSRKDSEGSISLSRKSSIRTWKSSDSSASRLRPSLLNLFGNASNGTKSLGRTDSHSRFSNMRGKDMTGASRRVSCYTAASDASANEYTTSSRIPSDQFFSGELCLSDAEQSGASEVSESVFSGWTGRSNITDSSWNSSPASPSSNANKLVQSLSDSSFFTQSSEITVSPRESVKADEKIATTISISAANTMPIEIRDSHWQASHTSTVYNFPLPNSSRPGGLAPSPWPEPKKSKSHRGWPMTTPRRNSGSWEAPEIWDCPLDDEKMMGIPPPKLLGPPLIPIKNPNRSLPVVELSDLQRSIRRMESASPKIILERLQEEWLGVADASVYRELELEKQLWMLTALEVMTKRKLRGAIEPVKPRDRSSPVTKILSLYENHACSSFLSALSPQAVMHHISSSPLSPTSYPNVHPLCIPLTTAHLPYASNIFTSIHAFSLPTLLPAASIPTILKECHRTLIASPKPALLNPPSPTSPVSFSSNSTGTIIPARRRKEVPKAGTIHLTLLDPAPLPETLGPLLRTWLNDHLILTLERQFRCTNPSRLFPIWLSDAGLRADGSTIVHVRFLACMENERGGRGRRSGGSQGREEEYGLKTELKSVVGRMLWKAMWGSFVEGDSWWWEDEEIVQECLERETCWEYSVIEGVKAMR